MALPEHTPILVGVGQFTERLDSPGFQARSSADIAAEAARAAFADTLSLDRLAPLVDAIATTRTFEDSTPRRAQPFGKPRNFPRSVARRLGLNPREAVWAPGGGHTPQQLVHELMTRLATGELRLALLAGGEAISTARWLQAEGRRTDWSDTADGPVDDRGMGMRGLVYRYNTRHGLLGTPPPYGLCETARRARLGLDRAAYAQQMGALFAPFTAVAAANPFSSSAVAPMTPGQLVQPGPRNRLIAEPYPQRLVARDQVNQGAAVLLTTVGLARELGIAEAKWVYLHGHCALAERELLQRQDLGQYPAAVLACRSALQQAGLTVDELACFDFYSCYPIAVSAVAVDGLGLRPDDPRGLTTAGGLPYFGGPGNNYSTHALCSLVQRLRAQPGSAGLLGANGGYLSKYAVGVYSSRPAPFTPFDSRPLQAVVDAWPAPPLARQPQGPAVVETYTVVYARGEPEVAVVMGRTPQGERFLARSLPGDSATVQALAEGDGLGLPIAVRATSAGNRFALSATRLDALLPPPTPGWPSAHPQLQVQRDGHRLTVTLDHAAHGHRLSAEANEALAAVWDAYEADGTLWVAVLTGAGTEAFCCGHDGPPPWTPPSGFGGLTARRRVKPVIAAVNGLAAGAGTELALACDLVVADAQARFTVGELDQGLMPIAGGAARLPRQIPHKIALEHLLTGRPISAERAAQLGLVNRLVPAGQALAGALALADEIAAVSPLAVRLTLQAVHEAQAQPDTPQAAQEPSTLLDVLMTSADQLEGARAQAEGRAPVWKNQ